MMAKAAPWKKDRVTELTEILSGDGIVGIVDIGGVPAGNMLGMRSELREQMTIPWPRRPSSGWLGSRPVCPASISRSCLRGQSSRAVSYTHLTLPTILRV